MDGHGRIQPRFRGSAGAEKVGIDGGHVAVGVEDGQGEEAHEDNVRIYWESMGLISFSRVFGFAKWVASQ